MSWDGNGNYTRSDGTRTGSTVWLQNKNANIKVSTNEHDNHDQDLAAGINACIAKNGENAMSGNLDMGNNAFDNLDSVTAANVIEGSTIEATGDTAAGDNSAMGYTATEGLVLTGQGSTNDVTIKNDADGDVITIPTGGTIANIEELTLTTDLAIAQGGTGQSTKTPAFNALAPATTKGDVIVHNGTNNIRIAVGTNDQVIVADSTQASGIKWAPISISSSEGASLAFLSSATASASSSLDFTSDLTSTYDEYVFVMTKLIPATNDTRFVVRFSTDGGSSYIATGYTWSCIGNAAVGTSPTGVGTGEVYALMTGNTGVSNTANKGGVSGTLSFYRPTASTLNTILSQLSWSSGSSSSNAHATGSSYSADTTAKNAIRFMFSSGNIASGTVAMYGVKKS